MVRIAGMDGRQEDLCYDEIGLYALNISINLGAIVNTIFFGGGGNYEVTILVIPQVNYPIY